MGREIYIVLATVAGSIASLGFINYRAMSRSQILLALFTAGSFSFFFGPAVIRGCQSIVSDYRLQGSLYWMLATGANVFIGLAVKWGARIFGLHIGEQIK